jgi:hypothetical protein
MIVKKIYQVGAAGAAGAGQNQPFFKIVSILRKSEFGAAPT